MCPDSTASGTPPAPSLIKKYANRRLYNTDTSVYITLDDLGTMVKNGEDFVVVDAKTGEDITRPVLTQIIFEMENRGQNLLPVSFLRQLIRFYGDSLQALVPGYLDMSLQSFAQDHTRWRDTLKQAIGAPFEAMQGQIQKNMAMFEKAFTLFSPFAPTSATSPPPNSAARSDDLEALREQVEALQKKIDGIR